MSKIIEQEDTFNEAEFKKFCEKGRAKKVDMDAEMKLDVLDNIVFNAIEKYAQTKNYEAAAQTIKNLMDKKYGASWHCIIGEGFGFDITYQSSNMIYMFQGNLGIVCFKC